MHKSNHSSDGERKRLVRGTVRPMLGAGLLSAAVLATALAAVPAQARPVGILVRSGVQAIDRVVKPLRELPPALRDVDPASATTWADGGRGVAIGGESPISMSPVNSKGSVITSNVAETVILDSERDSDSVIQRTQAGGRIIEVIRSSSAPSEFSYRLNVPQGQTLTQMADGSILVGAEARSGDRVTVSVSAVLSPAWARDAHGKAVPARYTIDHAVVAMHVDHSRVSADSYPIVADPTVSRGGWQASWSIWSPSSVTVRANRYRTSQICRRRGGYCLQCLGIHTRNRRGARIHVSHRPVSAQEDVQAWVLRRRQDQSDHASRIGVSLQGRFLQVIPRRSR